MPLPDVSRELDRRNTDRSGWNGPTQRARLTQILHRERTSEPFEVDTDDESDAGEAQE